MAPMMSGQWTGITAEYFLQALIAAEHAVTARAEDTRVGSDRGPLRRAGAVALLADLGLVADARGAYIRALELCGNQAEADHLRSRIRQLTEA